MTRLRSDRLAGVGLAVVVGLAAAAPGSAAVGPDLDLAVSDPKIDPYYPAKGSDLVDALHYGLDLRWSAKRRSLSATATIDLRVTKDATSVSLDFSKRLTASAVQLDGTPVHASHAGNKLVVDTGAIAADSRHSLSVVYRGHPGPAAAPTRRSDIPSVGWTNTRNGGMRTMQEPFGAFTWYPVNDHPSDKAFYDIRVDVPSRFVAVSNGKLLSRSTQTGRTVTRWRMDDPASSYLITLAIDDFVRVTDEGPRGLPITYWVRRDQRAFIATLRRTPSILRRLERQLGPYPFDRAGVVVVPSASAMETQELVTMGAGRMRPTRDAESVLAHEFAHQWYGDTITPNNWPDLWLNEAFAMYVEINYRVARGWETERRWRRDLVSVDQFFRSDGGPPGAYDKADFGGACVYYCGALMLFELEDQVGAPAMASIIRAWPQTHLGGNADRTEYIDWINNRTARDLTPFFTDWLMSPFTPPV
jgi:aminopeptidase N